MFMNSSSPRGSFSVPVNITLQGARRRQTREAFHLPSEQKPQWRKDKDGRSNERAKAQAPVSSVGEERAILLGFSMMAFSILMYFVVGIAVVKPCINSDWQTESNCSLIEVVNTNKWEDCRGISSYPCLQAWVNVTNLSTSVRLRHDEDAVHLSPECFYTPKCQHDKEVLKQEAEIVQQNLSMLLGHTLKCYISPERHPKDAILLKKCEKWQAVYHLLWPSLMLVGGVLLVGLVKFTQHLAHLCSELDREGRDNKHTAMVNGRLYRLLRWRAGSPTTQHDSAN
ncbi:calcium-activated potassium channel subunit beta-3 [Chanos chanos]|uniref:Calcium-activated potassium channel subunit beta-3 n=1 Tax=Chanos chanos TaxID=29144 RepID=A0A6J2VH37_CHACN|nr:calcium-activated potassium channel subunit beta-3-like [Chanos chanos]